MKYKKNKILRCLITAQILGQTLSFELKHRQCYFNHGLAFVMLSIGVAYKMLTGGNLYQYFALRNSDIQCFQYFFANLFFSSNVTFKLNRGEYA